MTRSATHLRGDFFSRHWRSVGRLLWNGIRPGLFDRALRVVGQGIRCFLWHLDGLLRVFRVIGHDDLLCLEATSAGPTLFPEVAA